MDSGPNLLVALHRLASRQDENFVTESFAHLLRRALVSEPDVGVSLLSFLTGNRVDLPASSAPYVSISTQVSFNEGRPDIEIRTVDHLVFVEVKTDSGLGLRQLERYRAVLDREERRGTLVLLSRHPFEPEPGAERPDVPRRWFEVIEYLRRLIETQAVGDAETLYLNRQFVEFGDSRGLSMKKVGWALRDGVTALWDLMAMIEHALRGHGSRWSVGRQWAGMYVDGAWAGVRWEEPSILIFHTEDVPVDEDAAERVGHGMVRDGKWRQEIDLESEGEHFFARSREGQMLRIESFLADGLKAVETLRG